MRHRRRRLQRQRRKWCAPLLWLHGEVMYARWQGVPTDAELAKMRDYLSKVCGVTII